MNITIGFSTTNSIVSRVIRWFTRSKASHAWVAFDDSCLGKRLVMEATSIGFHVVPWEKWLKENKIVAEFSCSKRLSRGLKDMANRLGQDYDYWSAIGLFFRRWLGRKRYINILRNQRKLQCSEAIALLLQGVKLAQDFDPESTIPEDLLTYCEQNSDIFKRVE